MADSELIGYRLFSRKRCFREWNEHRFRCCSQALDHAGFQAVDECGCTGSAWPPSKPVARLGKTEAREKAAHRAPKA
jgi:hypothetical protein